MKKKYTFFVIILSMTVTVTASTKYEAKQYVKSMLDLKDSDSMTCLGINL